MKNIIRLTETELRDLVSKSVKKYVFETSRRQKAQQAIYGKNRRVKTMAIISAQNPMGSNGNDLPKYYNKSSHEELLQHLKIGHYRYFVTPGKYETPETSVIVYNISLEDTLYLCYRYNQESVIFIDIQGDDVSYQYWEGDDHQSPLKLQHERHEIINATNDDDFYTQISKKFKFRIPFFESIKNYLNYLDERSNILNVDQLIDESLDNKWNGKHKYYCRGKINGKIY